MFNNRSRREKLILIAGVLSVCAFAIIKLIDVPMYEVNKLNLNHIQIKTTIIFHIKMIDINCPQHIQPRYTEEEMGSLVENLKEQINHLKQENEQLKKGV